MVIAGRADMKGLDTSGNVVTDLPLAQRNSPPDIVRLWSWALRMGLNHQRIVFSIVLAMSAAAVCTLWYYGYLTHESVMSLLRSHPFLAPIMFLAIYAAFVICLVPTLPLNLGAGLLWGPLGGGVVTILGASVGAACAFLAARYLAADYLNVRFSGQISNWLRNEIHEKGWKGVAFVRINLVFPFGLASYFFGLTSIGFRQYILATALSIAPLSIAFALVGHSFGSIVLGGDAGALLSDIMIVSLTLTALAFLKIVVKSTARTPLA